MRILSPIAVAGMLALSGCGGFSPDLPVESQRALGMDDAGVPGARAKQLIAKLKEGQGTLLDQCLARYQADTGIDAWRFPESRPVAITASADKALDDETLKANPDGWVDEGQMRADIVSKADHSEQCLVCRYTLEDSDPDPLLLTEADRIDSCR